MVHLPIHHVNEVRSGGPIQFRWMYFPERYLGKLKGYVHYKSRLEGSISEGYFVEKCLTLCSRYLNSSVETRLNRVTRSSNTCDPCEVEDSNFFFPALVIPLEERKRVKQFL